MGAMRAVRVFACSSTPPSVLHNFPELECNTDEGRLFMTAAVATLLFYGFGIGVAFQHKVYTLHKNEKLEEPDAESRYDFLYEGLKKECWWWGVCVCWPYRI